MRSVFFQGQEVYSIELNCNYSVKKSYVIPSMMIKRFLYQGDIFKGFQNLFFFGFSCLVFCEKLKVVMSQVPL